MKKRVVLSLAGGGLLGILALVLPVGASFTHQESTVEVVEVATQPVVQQTELKRSPSQEVDEEDPALSYFFVLGWQLIPRDSDLEYTHTRGGCIQVMSGGRPYLTFPLTIPEGSIIKYMRIYYRDVNVEHSMDVSLNRYQVGQTFEEITSLETTETEDTLVSAELNEVVDGSEYQYSVDAEWLETGESLRICGVRVAYYDPFHAVFLPLILRD